MAGKALVRGLVKAALIRFLVYLHNSLKKGKAVAMVLILELGTLARVWRENSWWSPNCEMGLALEFRHASPYVYALSTPLETLQQDSTLFNNRVCVGVLSHSVLSDSLWPYGLEPTGLFCPTQSVCVPPKSLRSCLSFCDPKTRC